MKAISTSLSAAALAWALPATAAPNAVPSGVTLGNATIERDGGTTTVKLGSSSRIEWSSFRIGQGETLRYLSNSSTGAKFASLNIVKGAARAQIDGSVLADGPFYLVSPAGITVGTGGFIQAPQVFLSALTPANDLALLQGQPTSFTKRGTAGVTIQGRVEATDGNLSVSGGNVTIERTGSLLARNGTAQVVATSAQTVSGPDSSGLLVMATAAQSGEGIVTNNNGGNIQARRVEVFSDGTIRNAGRIESRGAGNEVVLRAPSIRHEARPDGSSVILTSKLTTQGTSVVTEGPVIGPNDGSNPSGVGGLRQTPRLSKPGLISTIDARTTQLSSSPLQVASNQTTSPIPPPNRSSSTLAARRGAEDDEAKRNAVAEKTRGTVRKASFFGQTVTR